MALVLADRVRETTTTTGTGTVTLLGAFTGYQSFAAVGNGNTTYYTIAHQTLSEWEVGIGTYTSAGTTLSRTTILSSSNAGAAVTFSAGTKDVFVTQPSSRAVYADGTTLTATNSSVLPVASGGTGLTTTPANGALDIGNGTGFTRATLTAGTGISITNGAGSISIAATGGGTVTSVGGTGTVNGITLTGTVTTSGNLTLGGTLSGVSLSSQVTGTLPIANGGTGSTTLGAGIGNNGQTWQNVSASRTGNTTYTNSTGQAIFIIAGGHCQPSQEYRLIINGTATGLGNSMGGGMSGDGTIAAIILSGQTYQVSASVSGYVGGGPPYGWWELR